MEEKVVIHLLSSEKDSSIPLLGPSGSKLETKKSEEDYKKHDHDGCMCHIPDVVDVSSLEGYIKSDEELRAMRSEAVRDFYRDQNAAIEAYKVADRIKRTGESEQPEGEQEATDALTNMMVRLSFWINIVLFILKVTAAIWSSSLSLIASAIDSALDILSGGILFVTNRAINTHEPYKYPQGKSRLEPLGIMLFACAMAMAGLEVIVESIQDLVTTPRDIRIDALPIAVVCITIGSKTLLWTWCRVILLKVNSGPIDTLAADHRNDVITNICAIVAAFIAFKYRFLAWLDPVGAILLSIYIVVNWYQNGKEQVAYLVGKSAPPQFIAQVVYLAAQAPGIQTVDTVLAYHYGIKFLVECHIGLKKDMLLKEAHDIGETLERQIEKLDLVEKCFVHLDYETTHQPEYYRFYKKKDKSSEENEPNSTPKPTKLAALRGSIRRLTGLGEDGQSTPENKSHEDGQQKAFIV